MACNHTLITQIDSVLVYEVLHDPAGLSQRSVPAPRACLLRLERGNLKYPLPLTHHLVLLSILALMPTGKFHLSVCLSIDHRSIDPSIHLFVSTFKDYFQWDLSSATAEGWPFSFGAPSTGPSTVVQQELTKYFWMEDSVWTRT